MDIKHFATAFVMDKCAATASVQIEHPDTTATYIGAGELVITKADGTALAVGDISASVKQFTIHMRNKNGEFSTPFEVKVDDIIGYVGAKFKAATECTVRVNLTDFAQTNHTYTLLVYDDRNLACGNVATPVTVVTGSTALSKLQLATAFVDKINQLFKTDNTDDTRIRLTASLVDTDKIQIVGVANSFDPLLFPYYQSRFTVVTKTDFATITDNKIAGLSTPTVAQKHEGTGLGKQVKQAEVETQGFANTKFANVHPLNVPASLTYNADTAETYDVLTLQVRVPVRGFSNGELLKSAHIYFPVTDNTTSQAAGHIATLNAIAALKGFAAFTLTA